MVEAFYARLGIAPSCEADFEFIVSLMQWMEKTQIPFERFFFDWFCGRASEARAEKSPVAAFYSDEDFAPLRARLFSLQPVRPERLAHPYFSGAPCTMLIDEVESIWTMIASGDDWTALHAKLDQIALMREAYGFDASRFISAPYTEHQP